MGSRKEQIGRRCPFCGSMVTVDEYFCRACHTRLPDQDLLDAPSTHRPETMVFGLGRVYFSAVLAIIAVGLGQFYNGDLLRGLGFSVTFLIVAFSDIGGVQYHTILYFGIWFLATCEGIYSSWQINQYKRSFSGKSLLLWAELGFLALVVLLHFATGIPGMEYLGKIFPLMNLAKIG